MSGAYTNMAGFRQPTDFNSLMGYGQPGQMNPLTGTTDYLTPMEGSYGGAGTLTGFGEGGQLVEPSFLDGMLGTKGAPGWGGMALGAASGLANAFLGMKQYGIARDTLAENKKQFGLNYDAQKRTTNASLEDRQRARVASNPGAYQSVSDYMQQNAIRG